MNLSRLVSIAGFKKRSARDDYKLDQQQTNNASGAMWEDCL